VHALDNAERPISARRPVEGYAVIGSVLSLLPANDWELSWPETQRSQSCIEIDRNEFVIRTSLPAASTIPGRGSVNMPFGGTVQPCVVCDVTAEQSTLVPDMVECVRTMGEMGKLSVELCLQTADGAQCHGRSATTCEARAAQQRLYSARFGEGRDI
jgi:hypothetical protein